jgi:hypothetical protein
MASGTAVESHVLKMIGYIERLGKLGHKLERELSIDLILQSLPDSFSQFVMNYHMNKIDCSLAELLNMLKTAEGTVGKGKQVLLVTSSKGKAKAQKKSKKAKATPKPTPKIAKDKSKDACFHCGETGHWRRNCKGFLSTKKKHSDASTSGIFMIEINITSSKSNHWVLDTGCGSHICTNMQALRRTRDLKKGEVDLRVGNGASVAALAVGVYFLSLPSGLVLKLNNCYFVPALTKSIISISALDVDGFYFTFKNKCCSFSRDGIFYGTGILSNGLYILDMNVDVLNINNKKAKTNDLNESYLWHCRLGHINKNRISKLHKDGMLDQFDYESFDTCEACLLGKMTKSPFSGKGIRSNELLELIHTDVCDPMTIQAKEGYSYFITFTDDHSCYGYIYLMKYKSEAFEKFKEFRNEVEKQLGKEIKNFDPIEVENT